MIPKVVPGSIRHCSHVKRLQKLIFGPTKPFLFTKIFGRSLLCNYDARRLYSYSWQPRFFYSWQPLRDRTCGLATTSDNIMSSGKHFMSFQFHNMKSNDYLMYQIGLMRPLSDIQWSDIKNKWNYFNIFCSHVMKDLNAARNKKWKGNIDCCLIRPRKLGYRWVILAILFKLAGHQQKLQTKNTHSEHTFEKTDNISQQTKMDRNIVDYF